MIMDATETIDPALIILIQQKQFQFNEDMARSLKELEHACN